MKKAICLFLSVVLCTVLLPTGIFAGASFNPQLRFNKDGEFKILHISDIQDDYPVSDTVLTFLDETLKNYKPDLVVLGGDNTVNSREKSNEEKANAVKQICDVFVANQQKFTLVFGNHDRQQILDYQEGLSEEEIQALQDVTNDKLLALYQEFGGDYCLAYDDEPALHGCATHSLPIYKNDASKIAYALYMLDSGENTVNDEGEGGYDYVRADQVEWLKERAGLYRDFNAVGVAGAASYVPSMAFQHIIVGEIMDVLYKKTDKNLGSLTKIGNGSRYILIPNITKIDGWLGEAPCPGVGNDGELDALSEIGCVAVYSGHDHTNEFTVNIKGVDVVNTPGCTFHSYGKIYNRGARLITIHEDSTDYETEMIVLSKAALSSDSSILEASDKEMNRFTAILGVVLRAFLYSLVRILQIF